MGVINWRLVQHPLNWVTVFLMVFLVGLLAHFSLTYFASWQSAAKSQPNPNPAAQGTAGAMG